MPTFENRERRGASFVALQAQPAGRQPTSFLLTQNGKTQPTPPNWNPTPVVN